MDVLSKHEIKRTQESKPRRFHPQFLSRAKLNNYLNDASNSGRKLSNVSSPAASFSESFYGLLRVPLSVSSEFSHQHRRLPRLAERGSLALLVLLPYLRGKAERVVDRWREDQEDGRLGKVSLSPFDIWQWNFHCGRVTLLHDRASYFAYPCIFQIP